MGLLQELSSRRTLELEPNQTVGRASTCALRLTQRYVSAQHALIRWAADRWQLRDLGSRNGTFYEGVRLPIGRDCVLKAGTPIVFGKRTDPGWALTDDSPPRTMVVPLDGGEPILFEREMLALPSSDNPRVTIYRDHLAQWVVEYQNEALAPIVSGSTFDVAGRAYRFCCADTPMPTIAATTLAEIDLGEMSLEFTVSQGDRSVAIRMKRGERVTELAHQRHGALLLKLARRRVQDRVDGLAESACGWTDEEDLLGELVTTASHLNVEILRIRQMFATCGVTDAARIVERRPRVRQIRIGTQAISIVAG